MTKQVSKWLAVPAGEDTVRLLPMEGGGVDFFVKLNDYEKLADEIERAQDDARQGYRNGTALQAEIERLRASLREVYEVWAGSDGFIPQTAAEAYQERIIQQMRDAAQRGLSVITTTGAQDEPTQRRVPSYEREPPHCKSCECPTESEEVIEYSLEYALLLAGLWRDGKMIGGDQDAVIQALLTEVERCQVRTSDG